MYSLDSLEERFLSYFIINHVQLWTGGIIYKLKNKYLLYLTIIKDYLAEESENKLFKHSELVNFRIRTINSF